MAKVENTPKTAPSVSAPSSRQTIFGAFEASINVSKIFGNGVPVQYFSKIMIVMGLLIFYIGNTHMAERTVWRTEKMKAEVEVLKADFTSMKSDLMVASMASEVAKKVHIIGLKESLKPPVKLKKEEQN